MAALRRAFSWFRERYLSVDPRSLGAFRIGFGALLLYDLLRRVPVLVAFYTNDGVLTNHYLLFRPQSRWLFSLFLALSTPTEVRIAFALVAAVYVLYTIGYRTRVAQIAAFVLVTSLHARVVMMENGGDVVMNLLAAWTLFLPLGRRFSLDAVLASLRSEPDRTAAALADPRRPPPPPTAPVVTLAMLALLLQFAVIWGFNAGNKIGPSWRNGTAVWWILHQERIVSGLGVLVREHVPLFFLRLLSWATLGIEGLAPILLLLPFWRRRARFLAVVLCGCLHLGLGALTNLGAFQGAMVAFLLLLPGPAEWQALGAWHRRRTGELVLVYDADCGICVATARLCKRLDPLRQITLCANTSPDLPAGVSAELAQRTAVVVERASGATFTRARAFARLFRSLPGWAPLGWLLRTPGIAAIADLVYDQIAGRRHRISAALGLAACGTSDGPTEAEAQVAALGPTAGSPLPGLAPRLRARARAAIREILVAGLLLVSATQVLVENRGAARLLPIHQPELFAAIVQYPRLFQGWAMFAPDAQGTGAQPEDDGTIVVDATTVDGRRIDPLTGEPPRFEVLPPHGRHPMQPQWCDYFNRIHQPRFRDYRNGLREYIQHLWLIEGRPPTWQLVRFGVYWVTHQSPPPGHHQATSPVQKELLISYP